MKYLIASVVGIASLCVFGQGKVVYQHQLGSKISSVEAKANSAKGIADALNAAVTGDDFVVVVTNYDSLGKMPAASFKFKEQDGSGKYRTVWNELDRWLWFFNHWVPTNLYTKAAQDARFAQKAWGQYASALGSDAPDDRLWVTQPVVLSCGLEWVPHTMESGGAIWVLTANGVTPSVTTNGYFRLCDESNNPVFEVVAGDKELVGAYCEGITRNGNVMTLTYATDSQPMLEGCADIRAQDWKDPAESGCTVKWSGTKGAYVATVTTPPTFNRYFIRGKYERGTKGYIRNTVPVKIEGGIVTADGIKIRPVVNGSTVTWEVVRQ